MPNTDYIDYILISRDGNNQGVITRELGACAYGCGIQLSVKWDDGCRSYPCSAGIIASSEGVFRLG
jgi:hypothetical protein